MTDLWMRPRRDGDRSLAAELETEFNVSMDGVTLTTVGALYDWIRAGLASDSDAPPREPYGGALWDRYLDVVTRSTGIRRRDLRPDASYHDLGLD